MTESEMSTDLAETMAALVAAGEMSAEEAGEMMMWLSDEKEETS